MAVIIPSVLVSMKDSKEISPCASEPCLNNGICSSDDRGYSCLCPESFTGKNCQNSITTTTTTTTSAIATCNTSTTKWKRARYPGDLPWAYTRSSAHGDQGESGDLVVAPWQVDALVKLGYDADKLNIYQNAPSRHRVVRGCCSSLYVNWNGVGSCVACGTYNGKDFYQCPGDHEWLGGIRWETEKGWTVCDFPGWGGCDAPWAWTGAESDNVCFGDNGELSASYVFPFGDHPEISFSCEPGTEPRTGEHFPCAHHDCADNERCVNTADRSGFTCECRDPVKSPCCADKDNDCASLAASGNCSKNPMYMREMCKESCGLCPTATTTTTTTTSNTDA
ncbi:Oidioi.mRNA.OKI2018_I69.chr2.g5373.t1.cds [Oikopleura dioica]|uniref:Oidioi.mRNA.OKI2018_I69.chr2.g5373.t1.cds n=1 Tax=Oikopleura dioica TaxID=34765 RepID=A0ABN7T1U4_OIKDI|nr:Oidioi.mRNA.OKI2018_I69.chr2.g5373.t1.cds [Oikopleura dioica]